jgi:predicted Zn-dependent peptidase
MTKNIFRKKHHFLQKPSLLFLIFVINLSVYSQIQTDPIDSVQMKYELYKLENGLQVLLQPDSAVENVSVEFWLKTGIRDEKSDKHGFAHFFEHVTPFGLRGKTNQRKQLSNFRTGSNAQVRKDFIRYFTEVRPAGLALALEYTADRLNAKSVDITPERVKSERIRVLKEIERNSNNPFWSPAGGAVLNSAIYGQNHPYGHSGYGTLENNNNFRLEEFRKWYDKYVQPENTILFVVGNFNQNRAKQLIEKYFGQIKKPSNALKSSSIPAVTQPAENFTVDTNSKDNYLAFVRAIPGWGSDEDGSLRIVADILDKRLQEKKLKEINQTSSSDLFDMFQYAGQFVVFASFSKSKDKAKIENFLQTEIQMLINEGITENELDQAKQNEIQTILEMKKTPGFQESRTELLGEGLLFKNDPDYYFIRLEKQLKLKKEEINQTAREWLGKKPAKILFRAKG